MEAEVEAALKSTASKTLVEIHQKGKVGVGKQGLLDWGRAKEGKA